MVLIFGIIIWVTIGIGLTVLYINVFDIEFAPDDIEVLCVFIFMWPLVTLLFFIKAITELPMTIVDWIKEGR